MYKCTLNTSNTLILCIVSIFLYWWNKANPAILEGWHSTEVWFNCGFFILLLHWKLYTINVDLSQNKVSRTMIWFVQVVWSMYRCVNVTSCITCHCTFDIVWDVQYVCYSECDLMILEVCSYYEFFDRSCLAFQSHFCYSHYHYLDTLHTLRCQYCHMESKIARYPSNLQQQCYNCYIP